MTGPVERFDRGLEAVAYFVGCAGPTDAVKDVRASRIVLSAVHRNGVLTVLFGDDGLGGARPAAGSGQSGLTDRVAALGGTLRIHSDDGAVPANAAAFTA